MKTTNGFIVKNLEQYVKYSDWIEWHGEQDRAIRLGDDDDTQGLWIDRNHIVILRHDGSWEVIRDRYAEQLVNQYRVRTARHMLHEGQAFGLTDEEVEYLSDIVESEGA